MTQFPSQSRSCGQILPQISGNVLVAWLTSYASSSRFSAVSFSQSGMLLWSGQCVWQGRNAALRTARGLFRGAPCGVFPVDLPKVFAPVLCRTLLRHPARYVDEGEHFGGHRWFSAQREAGMDVNNEGIPILVHDER